MGVFFWFLTMKVQLALAILLVLIGLGYSFKISDLLDNATFHETQRQSTVEDQILPVFGVAFMASLVNNVIFGTNTEKPMTKSAVAVMKTDTIEGRIVFTQVDR